MKEKIAEWLVVIQGFRKFLICLLTLVISVVFRTKSLLSGGEFVDLTKATVLAFMGTNSMEGLFAVVKDHLAARRAAGSVLDTPKDKPDDSDEEVSLAPTGDSK